MPAPFPTLRLIVLGGPGSGKGTHGQFIADTLKIRHISTGLRFRREIAEGTALGCLAETYIGRGQLVPDAVATRLVAEILSEREDAAGFILDGYPRSLPQAQDLNRLLQQKQQKLDAVFYLRVSDEEIVHRLAGRLTCQACGKTFHRIFQPPPRPGICPACGGELHQRADDAPATVRKRLLIYHEKTEPLIEFYREQKLIREIPAEGTPAEVKALVSTALQEWSPISDG
jgi:adenylate kinase